MIEKVINHNFSNKSDYRRNLILEFLNEDPGSSTHKTNYCYFVEQLSDGRKIYLKRPTYLNKGMDFEVRVEGTNFRYGKYGNTISTGNRPSHREIHDDLWRKNQESPEKFEIVRDLVNKIYNCEPFSIPNDLEFETGHSLEVVLYSLKWLFIEQDITYWNKSGREMFYNGLLEI